MAFKRKILKYISMSPNAIGIERYVRRYMDQHSKFVHGSWLMKEDWGREVTMPDDDGVDQTYTIYGMWSLEGSKVKIMLKHTEGGPFRIEESKLIAQAMGYSRMRNLVTGEEHTWDFVPSNRMHKYIDEEGDSRPAVVFRDDEAYTNEDEDENEETYVDPLVKALQDALTEDEDTAG
jgi:hypothetical protein